MRQEQRRFEQRVSMTAPKVCWHELASSNLLEVAIVAGVISDGGTILPASDNFARGNASAGRFRRDQAVDRIFSEFALEIFLGRSETAGALKSAAVRAAAATAKLSSRTRLHRQGFFVTPTTVGPMIPRHDTWMNAWTIGGFLQ